MAYPTKLVATPMVKARFAWGNIFAHPFHWGMDPLLRQLQSLSMGASVNNMYAGGFLHADDIRTLASTSSTLEAQISTVKKFTEDNFLKLNASKCEVVAFKRASNRTSEERIDAGEYSFPVGGKATCLGYQWKDDLSSYAIQTRVQKAFSSSAASMPFRAH